MEGKITSLCAMGEREERASQDVLGQNILSLFSCAMCICTSLFTSCHKATIQRKSVRLHAGVVGYLQMARTQKNKATAHHLGLLKARLAKLRRELITPKGGSGGAAGEGKIMVH